jgi:PIN domain nuclease of toxin-antitoxin system
LTSRCLTITGPCPKNETAAGHAYLHGEIVAGQQASNDLTVIPLALAHILVLDDLPQAHRDPFDRALVAQAVSEGALLVSHDPVLRQYPVEIIW